jgi:hypothetical protein
MTLDQFLQCCESRLNVDWHTLTDPLVPVLKALDTWWQAQSDLTKKYGGWLGATALSALTAFLAKLLGITAAELTSGLLAFLGAVLLGIALGGLMDILDTCGIQNVDEPVA